jgi:hypothetical protein
MTCHSSCFILIADSNTDRNEEESADPG